MRLYDGVQLAFGPTIDGEYVRALVDRVNALSPDAVVITGDLVDGSVAELRERVAPLADLEAPHGAYFVTGNHEYYSGAEDWIAVTDDGHGMDPTTLDRIWEPFFTTKPPGKGTGLGLSISHRIIENHGGRLHIESGEGEYTTVTVDIPVQSAN